MEIRACLLLYLLKQECEFTIIYSDSSATIAQVRMAAGAQPAETETLYICGMENGMQHIPQGASAVIAAAEKEQIGLLEKAYGFLLRLTKWNEALLSAANKGALDEVMQTGTTFLHEPYLVFGTDVEFLYSTNGFIERTGNYTNLDIDREEDVLSLVDSLVMNPEYKEANEKKDVFLYPRQVEPLRWICYNFFEQDQCTARLLVCYMEHDDDPDPGLLELVRCFAVHAANAYAASKRKQLSDQNDSVHNFFRACLKGKVPQDTVSRDTLRCAGWMQGDEVEVLVLRFFEQTSWDKTAGYVCRRLEENWHGTCAIRQEHQVVWLVNRAHYDIGTHPQDISRAISDIVQMYVCKCGISNSVSDWENLCFACKEAENALEIGSEEQPHFWCYRFSDYALAYIVRTATQQIPAKELCHAALKKLILCDRQNDTQLLETLRVYLACGCNASLAAQRLYVHRTTLIRRLERIEELTQIKADDPCQMLHLLLSFRLLDTEKDIDR